MHSGQEGGTNSVYTVPKLKKEFEKNPSGILKYYELKMDLYQNWVESGLPVNNHIQKYKIIKSSIIYNILCICPQWKLGKKSRTK